MEPAASAESLPIHSWTGVVNSSGGPVIQGQPYAGRDLIINTSTTRQVKDSDVEDIARWLSPLQDQARQKELSTDRCQVGQWLLDSEEFKYWVLGQPWHLRCYGDAGSGKTFLSSILVSHLEKTCNPERNPVICLYLDSTQSTTHKLEDLFGSLLKQLLQLKKSNPISAGLRELYDNAKHLYGGKRTWSDLHELLQVELGSYERVYLVVDALDECHYETRRSLQTELCKLRSDNLSMIITSRDIEGELDNTSILCSNCKKPDIKIHYICNICKDFDLCQECIEKDGHCKDKSHKLFQPENRVELEISIQDDDLEEYVMWKLRKEARDDTSNLHDARRHRRRGRKLQGNADNLRDIAAVIVQRAEGSALLAKLYLDSIEVKECLNQKDIATLLSSFPKKVDLLYEKEMKRILDQPDAATAIKTLSRVSCALRPLSFAELQHSLATEPGTNEFNDTGIYDKEDLLWVTAGLITIDGDGGAVRVVHNSFQEYLEETGAKWFPKADVDMTRICLTYLNYDAFSQPCKEVEDLNTKAYPFIAYASQYWGDHVRNAGPNLDPDIRTAALRVANDPLRLAAYIQAAWATDTSSYSAWDVREGVTSLHVFAWFGLSFMIPTLVQGGLDVDVREPTYGQTPLMYACRRGHVEVVRQLLDFGARVNEVSARGRTALLEAVGQNNEDVVKLLLNKHELLTRPKLDLKAGNPRQAGQTALMLAAGLGYYGIVQSLLEHPDIDVNQQDRYGYTALSLAAAKGFESVVKLFFVKRNNLNIDVDLVDRRSGSSALMLAAERNEPEIVGLLLENGANPDLKDRQEGGIAIMRAIDYGCVPVIEIMLKYGVNYECKDDNGRGLIHSASASGLPEIIRLFGEKGLDRNLQDKHGFTPLHDASRNGKPEAIKRLLGLGADPTIKDHWQRTPLVVAWQYGQTEIMSILQTKGKTEPHEAMLISKEENLPIWSLVRLGRLDLIGEAITTKGSNLSIKEPGSDDSALHWAIKANQLAILRMLLNSAKMDPNVANHHQRTPLHLTAVCGYSDATSVLLKNCAKLEVTDRWGATPLSLAHANRYFPVAVTLIEAGACIDPHNMDVQKMFFAAVELQNTKAAQILIDSGANVVTKNSDGRWAMQLAKEAEDDGMLTFLKSVKSFPYRADEEKPKEDGGDDTPTPSPRRSSSRIRKRRRF